MIRKLKHDDAQAFFELRSRGLQLHPEAFGEDHVEFITTPLDVLEQRMGLNSSDGSCLLGAFVEDTLVGCVGLARSKGKKNQHKGFIWGMFVVPEQQGRGIGKKLMKQSIEQARQLELHELTLSVVTTNGAAIKLYESLGFVDYGIEPAALLIDGTPHAERLMRLQLRQY